MKIEDTYKAAYFLTQGAVLIDVEIRKAESKKKMLRRNTWVCVLYGVTEAMKLYWDTNSAVVNINDLKRERMRIKRLARIKLS